MRAILPFLLVLAAACSSEQPSAPPAPPSGGLLLSADLLDAVPVLDAVKKEDGAVVSVVGRVREVAKGTFTLVDDSFDYCGRGADTMDGCTTPWDYCCLNQKEVAKGTIVVKAVGPDGKPVAKDALGVRPLDLVAVQGKVERNAKGDPAIAVTTGWFRRERPVLGSHVAFD
jgi:hypothetical protein